MRRLSYNSQKILLLLLGGLSLGLSRNPRQYFRIVRGIKKEWDDISRRSIHSAIKSLYQSKLVSCRDLVDGSVELVLTEMGNEQALRYNLEEMIIPEMPKWDNKWRIVLFDIPEKLRVARDGLRFHLKKLNFFEYQKSVFAHPYNCLNEVNFLIEYHNVRPYVRFMIVDSMDNEFHLRQHFKLP